MHPPNDRRSLLEAYIEKYHFDVVILFEMFEDSFVNVSLPYIHHIPSSGYFVASRYPISNIHCVAHKMTRPLLSFEINKQFYLIAHIPPEKYCNRLVEETAFLQQLQKQHENSIIVADLNVQYDHSFVKDKIQELGWHNVLKVKCMNYLFQKNNKNFIQHVEAHHNSSISDHPLFPVFPSTTNIVSQLQILQQNIQNLQPIEKRVCIPFGKNGRMICKGNMSYFFKIILSNSSLQNCLLPKYYTDNRIL